MTDQNKSYYFYVALEGAYGRLKQLRGEVKIAEDILKVGIFIKLTWGL